MIYIRNAYFLKLPTFRKWPEKCEALESTKGHKKYIIRFVLSREID